MISSRNDNSQIESYRALVELRLSVLLERAESNVTVEEFKHAVFNTPHGLPMRDYLLEALEVFRADINSVSDEVLSVIQDAWNYFPRKSLKGKSPAERFGELHG